MDDIDVIEINEAFASVVLAWAKELGADLGKPIPTVARSRSATRSVRPVAILTTKAVHELERSDRERALVTMCCGGGLGTGTLLQRV